MSDKFIEILIYLGGSLGLLLIVILFFIKCIKKQGLGGIEGPDVRNEPLPQEHVFTNPVYNSQLSTAPIRRTYNRPILERITTPQSPIPNSYDDPGYIEIEHE